MEWGYLRPGPVRRRFRHFDFLRFLHTAKCEISAQIRSTVSPRPGPAARTLQNMGIETREPGPDTERSTHTRHRLIAARPAGEQLLTHIWKTAKGLDHDIPKWANGRTADRAGRA